MRTVQKINGDWTFLQGFDPSWTHAPQKGETVRLPHSAVELPYNYLDEKSYQRPFTYQKVLSWQKAFEGQEVDLVFDGVMADSHVFLNGHEIASHKDGYTPFRIRLTERLRQGDNLLTVQIDGSENPQIPPFGNVVDYLTYAGIYRDVWLVLTAPVSLKSVKIETPNVLEDTKTVRARISLSNPNKLTINGTLSAELRDPSDVVIASKRQEVTEAEVELTFTGLTDIALWDIDTPALYTLDLALEMPSGKDRLATRFGFREARFTPEGFFLNGQPIKIRGLNRHQSWPYLGYAMGRRGQEKDVKILKQELACNLVRTSHYPQSPWFLDRCDELGLMVFEEIPGWQHIGDKDWQAEAIANVDRMIRRDWNHPSIILWGARINESQDDHAFYTETNRLAHDLDPTRQTGGVRCIEHSELLEDVYTMNDFILGLDELPGLNAKPATLRDQQEVTGLDHKVPYLVTEYMGHMYPTKRFDQEQRQMEHVTRHLKIMDAAAADPSISGAIGWCMSDYNTHYDFGAGDRICYHGVLDAFREPKFAAYAYASQRDPAKGVVLKPVTYWARGERNIAGILPLIILTNCDYVELKVGEMDAKRFYPDHETYPHLPHPPAVMDLRSVSFEEFGAWGMVWRDATLTGFVADKPVKELRLAAGPKPTTLEIAADDLALQAAEKDTVRVLLRALDQFGNILPFFDQPAALSLKGAGRIIGPDLVNFKGGVAGLFIEAGETPGALVLTANCRPFAEQSVTFTIS